MTQLTSAEFRAQTDSLFPTNGVGAISALDLRTQMDNIPDSVLFVTSGQTAAPTVNDDGANSSGNGVFEIGDVWIDETNDIAYICLDNTTTSAVWVEMANISGSGVSISGTPVDNQLAIWTNATTIEGDPDVTWDGTDFTVNGNYLAGNGTAADPSFAFASDSTTGIYSRFGGSGTIDFLSGGSDIMSIGNSGQIELYAGEAIIDSLPYLIFDSTSADSNYNQTTFRRATDNFYIRTDGGAGESEGIAASIDATGFTAWVFYTSEGSLGPITGRAFVIDDDGVNTRSGTEALPSYAFIDNGDTGHYLKSTTEVAFSINATDALVISDTGLSVVGDLTLTGEINGDEPDIINVATSRNLALTDAKDILEIDTTGGAVTVTIPTNASVAFPIGTVINFTLLNTSNTASIAGDTGVTLNGVSAGSGDITATAYSGVSLYKRATDEWVVQGDIGAVA